MLACSPDQHREEFFDDSIQTAQPLVQWSKIEGRHAKFMCTEFWSGEEQKPETSVLFGSKRRPQLQLCPIDVAVSSDFYGYVNDPRLGHANEKSGRVNGLHM